MAANMQQMAGAGQMMPQQMRRTTNQELYQCVYESLVSNPAPPQQMITWQNSILINERLSKTMTLITNIILALPSIDHSRALDFGCTFERDAFFKLSSKEAYDQTMTNKTIEFYKKRQQNEPSIQNALNANAQHLQAQQNMMNMQVQMGRGVAQTPQQGFQFPQTMQQAQIPQQPQPQQPQPQQPQQPQQQQQQPNHQNKAQQQQQMINMALGQQAGRGMGANQPHQTQQQQQHMLGLVDAQNRQQQGMPNDLSRLATYERTKVAELGAKLMAQATEAQKAGARQTMLSKLTPQHLAGLQAQGKDPVVVFYNHQAYNALRNNMARLQNQGAPQNQTALQAQMMQAQHSQQSTQQRPNMLNGHQQNLQQDFFGSDSSQFPPNMDTIKDQQLNGFMAQQAGQTVVPASQAVQRNATPQAMNQSMQTPQQQGSNQGSRSKVAQQHQGLNTQTGNMNQAQQTQAQLQAQMRQMQGQQVGMTGGLGPSPQNTGINTLNTPVARNPSMNGMVGQGIGQANMDFRDQRFDPGSQRPNNQALHAMLANMTPEQRQAINGLPPEKLPEVLRKLSNSQNNRTDQIGVNTGSQLNANQMQNRMPRQFGQAVPGMVGPGQASMQQPGSQAFPNQVQMQGQRNAIQNHQQQAIMDSMDLPPQVRNQIGQLPPEVEKWRDLRAWIASSNHSVSQNTQRHLGQLQSRQFQVLMARRQAGQNADMNNMMHMSAGNGQPQQQGQQHTQQPQPQLQPQQPTLQQLPQQQALQRQMKNLPPQIFQVSPQEIMQLRNQRPQFAKFPDDQIRTLIIQHKTRSWQNQQMKMQQQQQQQQQHQQQQGVQMGSGQMSVGQGAQQMQQLPQQASPQQQAIMGQAAVPNNMSQTAPMMAGPKPQGVVLEQPRRGRGKAGNKQAPTPSPAQAAKNLKRSSPDDSADVSTSSKPAAGATISTPQPLSQQGPSSQLTPQQVEKLSPEQRAKYEQAMRAQLAAKTQQIGNQTNFANMEHVIRLKEIGQQELRSSTQEVMPDVPMSPQEYAETVQKLQRIAVDISKVSRGLSKWYGITRDDVRAKSFFRARTRVLRQFTDGEQLKAPREVLSIRSEELDAARKLLESIAKDLAASVYGRGMKRPPGAPQQGGQLPAQHQPPAQAQQSGQDQPAPLNAANLIKNSQALSKAQPTSGGTGTPDTAAGVAGASQTLHTSPHGNPSYIGKPKDINLKLPTARKRQKMGAQPAAQAPQGSTASSQGKTNTTTEAQFVSEAAAKPQPKPVLLCNDPDCQMAAAGFPNDEALKQHVDEEHVKPRGDPVKFVQACLASVLGLDPDGCAGPGQKAVSTEDLPRSGAAPRQGTTPGPVVGTPSQDTAAKRFTSSMGTQQGKTGPMQLSGMTGTDDAKGAEIGRSAYNEVAWAKSMLDVAGMLQYLGWDKNVPGMLSDVHFFPSPSPETTPEWGKDSGLSEPSSEISPGTETDGKWSSAFGDVLLDMDSARLCDGLDPLNAVGETLDPSLLTNSSAALVDWDDVKQDFSKPFQLDTSLYYMQPS